MVEQNNNKMENIRPRLYEGATQKELDRFQNTPRFSGDVVLEFIQTPNRAAEESFHVSTRSCEVDVAEKRIEHQLMPRSHKLWDWNKSRLVRYSVEDGAIVVKYSDRDITTVAVVLSEVELISIAWVDSKYKVYPCRVYRRPSGKMIALAIEEGAVQKYQPFRTLNSEEEALVSLLAKAFPKTRGGSRYWKYHKDSKSLFGNWKIYGGPDGTTPGWADLIVYLDRPHPVAIFYEGYGPSSVWIKKGRKAVAVNKAAYVNGRWHSVKAEGDALLLQKWYNLGGQHTPREMGLCKAPRKLMILKESANIIADSYWTMPIEPHISGGLTRQKVEYFMNKGRTQWCSRRYSDIILYPNGAVQEINAGDYEFIDQVYRVEKA